MSASIRRHLSERPDGASRPTNNLSQQFYDIAAIAIARTLYTRTLRMRALIKSISITVSTMMMMMAAVSEY